MQADAGRCLRDGAGSDHCWTLGGRWEAPGRDLLVQSAGLSAGLDPELVGQAGLELPIPAQSQVALSGQRVRAGHADGRLLAQRVDGGQALQCCRGGVDVASRLQLPRALQQPPCEPSVQLVAARFGPRLEAVLGEQVAAVQLDRSLQVPGLRGSLEGVDVDPEVWRLQAQHLVPQPQVLLRRQCLTREMDDLAQVGCGRLWAQVGPEQVHELLAVQP